MMANLKVVEKPQRKRKRTSEEEEEKDRGTGCELAEEVEDLFPSQEESEDSRLL